MSIDFAGMGNAGLNWDNILNAVNSQESATKIEGVKVAAEKEGVGVTFSVNEGGTVRTVELAMPMLDSPAEIDESLITDFCAKLGDGSVLNLTDHRRYTRRCGDPCCRCAVYHYAVCAYTRPA